MSSNLETALRLARAGLYILPCDPATKSPRLDRWPSRATNLANGVNYYWDRYGRDSMPGIAMGKSGLVAIDLDVKAGVDGVGAFDALLNQHGELPRCPVTRTPSGGYHLIFRQPNGRAPLRNGTGALPSGIDVRGEGGQVIAPGAIRDTGEFYESVPGWPDLAKSFAAGVIPEIPDWLVTILDTKVVESVGGPSGVAPGRALGDKSNWAAAGLDAEAHKLAVLGDDRNTALYNLVCTFAGHAANGWTTQEEVYAAAHWACTLNGYLASTLPGDGQRQFDKTFTSGWNWGYSHPTHGPRDNQSVSAAQIHLKSRAA